MSKKLKLAVLFVGVVGMMVSSGCATKRRAGGAHGMDGTPIDEFGAGGYLGGGEFIDQGMPFAGGSFTSLQPVDSANFAPVYFGYDNYQIPSGEYGKLEQVAGFLSANPGVVLVVEGHCDERGSNEYNMSLGEYRAQSLRSYLISMGVGPERIQTVSYGEEKPAAMGSGEAVWRLNRRGEFALYRQ